MPRCLVPGAHTLAVLTAVHPPAGDIRFGALLISAVLAVAIVSLYVSSLLSRGL